VTKEEHRLSVPGNTVLRRTFVPMRDEMVGGWEKPHNEELLAKYIRMIKPRKKG
jgi:hypothetical protein